MGLESCYPVPVLLEDACGHQSAGDEILFIFPQVASPLPGAVSARGTSRRLQADVSCHARYLYAGLRVADWVAATDKRTWDRPIVRLYQGSFGWGGEVKLLVGDIFFAVQLVVHPRRRFFPRCLGAPPGATPRSSSPSQSFY